MEVRMQEPHEKGVAIRSAPSFALDVAKCSAKRKQGKRWAGYRASKIGNQGADAVQVAEGNTTSSVRVGQVLRNLVSNALKFTERGEVRVSVRLSENSDSVCFLVLDTGIGIAPEDIAVIFHEFSQVQHSIQRSVKGTGLGLSLSRKLAGLLGGTLEVTSRLGVGSTFVLNLPARGATSSYSQPPLAPNRVTERS